MSVPTLGLVVDPEVAQDDPLRDRLSSVHQGDQGLPRCPQQGQQGNPLDHPLMLTAPKASRVFSPRRIPRLKGSHALSYGEKPEIRPS